MRSGFLSAEPPRVRRAKKALEEAELELRRRRQARLQAEGAASTVDSVALPPEEDPAADQCVAAEAWREAPGDLSAAALEALLEGDAPTPMAHRLAELLALLYKAPVLVSLDQAPLPRHVPWENLQILLRKTMESRPSAAGIVAALREKPWGKRLRKHLQSYLVDGDVPLSRERLAGCGALLEVFDFVVAALDRSQELGPAEARASLPAAAEAPNGAAGEVLAFAVVDQELGPAEVRASLPAAAAAPNGAAGEALAFAVVDQERRVAALRRELQEVKRSEAAALEFAAKNVPAKAAAAAAGEAPAQVVEPRSPADSGGAELAVADAALAPPVPVIEARKQKLREGTLSQAEVISSKQLQYRLGEAGVPPLQEAVLLSVENMILEPRSDEVRHLEIVGVSETREDDALAPQRAAAVLQWFVERGVPREIIRVEARPASERGARRVDLLLLGEVGSGGAVRQRAEDLLTRVGVGEFAPAPRVAPSAEPPAAAGTAPAAALADVAAAAGRRSGPRLLSMAEEHAAADSVRTLRLVFELRGLSASDVGVELAEDAVRLASIGELWAGGAVDVKLPFATAPPAAGAAKFSRKAGTLTIDLRAAT